MEVIDELQGEHRREEQESINLKANQIQLLPNQYLHEQTPSKNINLFIENVSSCVNKRLASSENQPHCCQNHNLS